MNTPRIGRYEIKGKLGSGGMATVYLAYDPIFERDVALKVLSSKLIATQRFQDMFNAEIKIIARLEHPAIVQVYDVGTENNRKYFVMRYLPGGSLANRIIENRYTLSDAAVVMSRICSALDHAHDKGIIHRDLKPGNILFDMDGNPYVSDFGIAKILQTNVTDNFGSDNQNIVIGTPDYMSPESADGRDVDRRSDIYSLGVILFEMLTGTLPYTADTSLGLIYKHGYEQIPDIRKLRADLHPLVGTVINTALAKNYEDRYSSASQMASVLASIIDTELNEGLNSSRSVPAHVVERKVEALQPNEISDLTLAQQNELSNPLLPKQDLVGQKVSRYEIRAEFENSEGLGTVYHAYDPMFKRDVALRLFSKEWTTDPQLRERIKRMAHISPKLAHPAIVPIHEVRLGSDSQPAFCTMRYMTGGSLKELIESGSLTIRETVEIMERLAQALDYVHAKGIFHRSLKPGNILFDEQKLAYLSDFVIVSDPDAKDRLTRSGIIGVAQYINPEQAKGENVDGRSEQYSLGVILFEMLCGRRPFEETTPLGFAFKHAAEPIPNILDLNPGLPDGVQLILEKILSKVPERRFTSVTEFAETLKRVLNNTDPEIRVIGLAQKPSKRINLSGQGLTEIPPFVFDDRDIVSLDLSNNQLVNLPSELGTLEKLEYLNLGNNQVSELPDFIGQLNCLTSLKLNNNLFTSVPRVLMNLSNLVLLDLSFNRITELPVGISKMQNLCVLELENNALVMPPNEVVKQGVNAVREYLRQLSLGQEQLFEAKLLILGEGGAGKTTLAKKIQNPNYVLLENEKSTEGIEVMKWTFLVEDNKIFKVNIWDFGGQEIYHTTHQYFLTKRSLYALVTDTRKEDTDFYYWLNVVELLTDSSPLLIVKNEKQDRHREINERHLRDQFSNLRSVVSTNLADNRGLVQVVNEIKNRLRELPHIGVQLPITWVRVREILEKDRRNYISQSEYLEICWANGFADPRDSLQLSEYLHDLGVILHFQEDPILRHTVILKPKWGTDATYRVLDNQTVIRRLGHFSRSDLDVIWLDPIYANMQDELLQLMMKFHLCYEVPSMKGMYIAPQLLSENQPQYEWNERDNLVVRYVYEFMPKGILTQFIVNVHSLIFEQNYVWRSGVVIERAKTRAEIIEFYGKREVRIRVVGAHKVELLGIVMYQLEQINSTYRRIKYTRLIPCNCLTCRSAQDGYFYSFDVLQKFREDGQDVIQCQKSYQMVGVDGLIDDVTPEKKRTEGFVDDGEKIMTKYEFRIESGAKIDGPIVLGSTIENSFIAQSYKKVESATISDELKELLQQLAQSIDKMSKSLPNDQAEDVAKDFEILVRESTNKTPRKKWFQLSSEGLIKAAETVGRIGAPVIELTGRVVSLLTVNK